MSASDLNLQFYAIKPTDIVHVRFPYRPIYYSCAPTIWWSAAALGGLMTGGGAAHFSSAAAAWLYGRRRRRQRRQTG